MLREKEDAIGCPTLSLCPLLAYCLLPVATSARSSSVTARQATEAGSGKRKGEACSQQTQAPAFVGLPRKGTKKVVVSGGQLLSSAGMNDTWTILYSKGIIKCRRETEAAGQREAGLVGLWFPI